MFSMAGKRIYTVLAALVLVSSVFAGEKIYSVSAVVDKIRSDNIAELRARKVLSSEKYSIFSGDEESGEIAVVDVLETDVSGEKIYRIICRYSVKKGFESTFKAGSRVVLVEDKEPVNKTYIDKFPKETPEYKKTIITQKDGREMVFVPSGRILIGSDEDDKNESPRHIAVFEEFYIDKYEVSNADYMRYVQSSGDDYPKSWNGKYPADRADFPVLVTYYEALKYAGWAEKDLPDEEKWEYAANGIGAETQYVVPDGLIREVTKTVYPWGDKFIKDVCNSADFWTDKNSFRNMKKGYLPVKYLEEKNVSAFGAVNMSGNAAEWTKSWYDRYDKSFSRDKRYGRQMKVVRGGSWYNNIYKMRITSRDCGGLPNLREDASFGFRCIKKAGVNDTAK